MATRRVRMLVVGVEYFRLRHSQPTRRGLSRVRRI
jgi:hypothetical protein